MRQFVVRVLSWISGALMGLAIAFLLEACTDLIVGNTPNNAQVLYTIDALLVIAAWLLIRRRVGQRLVWRSIAAAAAIVAVLVSAAGFIAGRKYGTPHDNAYVSTMKSDLRTLLDAEEKFKRDSGRYSASAPPGYHASSGVTRLSIALSPDGWYATVGHQRAMRVCVVYVGTTGFLPATREGEPACTGVSSGITDPSFAPWIFVLLVFAAIFGGAGKWLDRPRSQPMAAT